ncbi:MAG: RIP metalloprotease RseP [Patescibacteria group bacterium]
MLAIIIFIIILAVLIVVHELGHFFAAKISGVRVDEFGIGYPPRAATLFRRAGTSFTLNWIPFGGFVRIFGENPLEEGEVEQTATPEEIALGIAPRGVSFSKKSRPIQAFILVAGVTCNFLFAWLLISVGFIYGLPTSVDAGLGEVENPRLVLTSIVADSPSAVAGLKVGDVITSIESGKMTLSEAEVTPASISDFIAANGERALSVTYSRGETVETVSVTPRAGVIEGKPAIGIGMDMIGTLKLPVHKALWQGLKTSVYLTGATAVGLFDFVKDSVLGQADLSQVAGPVGIVGLVGDASKLGFIYVLSFTAFISINLAVINLLPFPALDGGRLLFVAIEAVSRRPINPKIANGLNIVGFGILILLMVVVTVSDVWKLF